MIYPIITQHKHIYSDLNKEIEEENLAGMIRTGSPLYRIKDHMDGSKEAIYHVNLVRLLDRVFTRDSMKHLSIEQERYISKFFEQAGKANDKIDSNNSDIDTSNNVDPYAEMDDVMRQLDNFLGSYFGVDYGRFAR